MIKKIFLALAALVAVFIIVAALQSPEYSLTRSTVINAAPAEVFPHINNFHNWENWSPWAKLDPNMKTAYAGPDSGVGAVYSWEGNMKVGSGKMTVVESQQPTRVLLKLDFLKPMKDTSRTEFTCVPENQGTKVTWSVSGKKSFIAKAMCLFRSMEKMIGPNLEMGLEQLKTTVESLKQAAPPATGG